MPRVFIHLFSNLVCTFYTPLARFHTPECNLCNVLFLCYKPNISQKMIGHSFWAVSVAIFQWTAVPDPVPHFPGLPKECRKAGVSVVPFFWKFLVCSIFQ